jgi:hypothetical protein
MIIVITSRRARAYGKERLQPAGTFGRDIMYAWMESHARAVLSGMEIAYTFRGYTSYRFSGPYGGIDNWIDFAIVIDETDYDLIKIALGLVRVFIRDTPLDELTDITDADCRKTLRMPTDQCEPWESQLSNPPKKTTIIQHIK